MSYIVPRVLIEQEFSQIPAFQDHPLSALIIGPQYKLFRYSEADEKPFTIVANDDGVSLNAYQFQTDTTYDFPNRPAGGVVDEDYVKLYFENAQAKYFPNATLGSATATVSRVTVPNSSPTKYYNNRFQAAINLTSANSTTRNAVLSNRDVTVGDVVSITNGSTVLSTKVKSLYPVVAASSVTTPGVNDTGNKATTSLTHGAVVWAGSTSDPTSGGSPRVIVANTSSAYVGYIAKGVATDLYTVTCTTAGSLTTARFTVSSANSVFADKTNVALASGVLTIDNANSNVVTITFTSSTFLTTDAWTVTETGAVTQAAPTVAGTYTGSKNIVYRLTVVRGGVFYTGSNGDVCARVAITSTDTDSSATVNVASATAFAVGSFGVTTAFPSPVLGGGLILGDVYLVTATAAANGAVQIVETTDVLPAALLSNTGTWTMSLYLVKNLQVGEIRSLAGNTVNWVVDIDASTIEVEAGIATNDSNLTVGGSLVDLPIEVAKIFVEHRDLISDNINSIASLRNAEDVVGLLGTVDPDNALAQGVYDAALNSNGVTVYYVGVASDDLAGYSAALELAHKTNLYHGITPLTFDATIQDLIVSHVNAMSTAANAKWRVAWLSRQLEPTSLIYDLKSDNSNWLGTVTDDTNVAGIVYNLVTIAGATLITDGVRTNDKVLLNFRLDSTGTVIHDEYIVDSVLTETTLKITTGLASAINSGIKVQIERVFTKDEQIDTLAAVAGSYNNRRVRVAFPDSVKNGSTTLDGYFVAAALAGLRSGVVPHQGLTNTELLGFTDVSEAVTEFTEDQLNRLAATGVWIVTQTVVGATPYVRHQLTTDESSLNTSEDSPTSNVDSISYGLQTVLSPFIGKYNRNIYTLDLIRNAIFNELLFRQTGTFTETAGNQLNGFTIVSIAPNVAFQDRIDVTIQLVIPYPYNFINVTLLV